MDGPQLERRTQERVAAGKSIKKEAENITERNLNASQNTICSTSIPEHSRADVSLADRSHDGLPDIDTSANASNGFHDDCSAENSSSFPDSLDVSYLATKTNKIQQIVENATSPESKELVTKILDQVQQLSVSEKLLLYLKLPTGTNISVDPLTQPINPLGSRFEIQQTITWIKTHLEENPDVSLPKQDVYDEYIGYCNNNAMKPLSTADFGKVMKQVFPRVRPRRLGTRGNSRYCYSGLRKRMKLDPPLLPDLGDLSRVGSHKPLRSASGCMNSEDEVLHLGHRVSPEQSAEDAEGSGDGEGGEVERDLTSAASHLVREWAEKLLGTRFNSLPQLARHLVKNVCVDNRSVAAFRLLSIDERGMRSQAAVSGGLSLEGDRKCSSPGVPLLPNLCRAGGKHREAQVQLQRKLHEREIIREQKRKIQDQQTGFRGGPALERTKTQTSKKAKLSSNFSNSNHLKRSVSEESPGSANKICHVEPIASQTKVADKCWGTDSPTSIHSGKIIPDSLSSKTVMKEDCLKCCQDENVSVDKTDSAAKSNGEMLRPKSAMVTSALFDSVDMAECKRSTTQYRSQSVLENIPSSGPSPSSSGRGRIAKMAIPRLPPTSKVSPCKQMTNIIIIPPVAGCTAGPPSSITPKSKKKYKPIQPKQSPEGNRGKAGVVSSNRRASRNLGQQSPSTPCEDFLTKQKSKKSKNVKDDGETIEDKVKGSVAADLSSEENALLLGLSTSDGSRPVHSVSKTSSVSVMRGPSLASTSSTSGGEMMSIPCLEKDALDDYLHGSNSQEEELMRFFQNSSGESEPSELKESVGEISCVIPNPPTEESCSTAGNKTGQLSQLRLLLERNLATSRGNTTTHVGRTSSSEFSSTTSSSAEFTINNTFGRSESAGGRTRPALPPLSSFGSGSLSGLGTRRRVSFETSVQELHTTTHNPCTTTSSIGVHAAIPPSPNTRRQIFSFTPISPGHDSPGTVGHIPNIPTSAASGTNASPFVSPRGTPVPRSRHDSGQTSVVASSTTTFVSPQATPTPFGRSRHCSSGGIQGGRGILNGSSQTISQHSTLRPRHSSGTTLNRHGGGQFSPGGLPNLALECSTDSSLPPPTQQQFVAPSETGINSRTRHGSASSVTPASPGSAPNSPVVQSTGAQIALSFLESESVAQPQGRLQAALLSHHGPSHYQYRVPNTYGTSVGGHAGDHQRQRHVSAGTALSTMRLQHSQILASHQENDGVGQPCSPSGLHHPFQDPLGQEVSNLLSDTANLDSGVGGPLGPPQHYRSQSVPLHRMLAVDQLGMSNSSDLPYLNSLLNGEGFGNTSVEGICPSRSHPTTPLGLGQRFGFSIESATSSVAPTPVPSEFADFGCMDTGSGATVLDGIGVTGGEDSLDNRTGDTVAPALVETEDSHLNAFLDDVVFLEGQSSVSGTRQFSSRSYPNTPVPEVGVAAAIGAGVTVEDSSNRRSYGDAMLASRSYPSTPLISAPHPLFEVEPTLNALNANPSGTSGSFSAQRNITDLLDQSQVTLEALLDCECDNDFSQLVQEVDAMPEG